ncbi:MAG TPA: hypothetical protein VH639_30025 [Bryobacteraceae bacterium]|jgi:hypothetical protein
MVRLCIIAGALFTLSPLLEAQSPTAITADYPSSPPGVLIGGPNWINIPNEAPARTRASGHGLAPALTYGIASATIIAEYRGSRAAIQIQPGRPVICICHVIAVPGQPVIVKLHPKKDAREFDGGKLHIGSKAAKAETGDLLPVAISQPEENVWLIQPEQALPPGEYALMLGTQNLNVFPFSVAGSDSIRSKP